MIHDDFEGFMRSVASQPYRKLVAERMADRREQELEAALREAEGAVPDRLSPQLPGYLEAATDKFLESRLFWEASTCREALANILELAAEVIRDDAVWQCHKRPLDEDPLLAASLFELSTAWFALSAARDGRTRSLMGLKKGWLR